MDCYAVAWNHNCHISVRYLASFMKSISNISNISKDSKICENKLFMSETKDASDNNNILAYVFYYHHHQIIQEAVQKDEYRTEKLKWLLHHSSQKRLWSYNFFKEINIFK